MSIALRYGLIFYQERRVHPDMSAADVRRTHWVGIVCAALTTAAALPS